MHATVKETTPRKIVVQATLSAAGVVTARGEVVAVPMPATMATPSGRA